VGQFAAAFSPRVIGLTGPKAEIDKVAKEFAVYSERGARRRAAISSTTAAPST
jgi:protein SCO1/2